MLKRFVFLFAVFFAFSLNAKEAKEYMPSDLYQKIGAISVAELESYISKGADINERDHRFGISLLGRAVLFNKDPAVVETLLKNGANIDMKDRSGKTPLMAAVSFNNNPEVIKLLLDHGADANVVDDNGINALMYAVAGQGSNITSYVKRNIYDVYTGKPIVSNFDKEDDRKKSIEIIRMIMSVTRHIDAIDKSGKNVLSHAAASNNLPDVIYMLASINPNFEDNVGNTPLFEAIAANQDMTIIDALLDIGADVNYRNRNGITALSVAAIGTRYPMLIDYLLKKGAKSDVVDKFGKMPMFYAKNNPYLNNSSIIKQLSK